METQWKSIAVMSSLKERDNLESDEEITVQMRKKPKKSKDHGDSDFPGRKSFAKDFKGNQMLKSWRLW